MKKLVHRCRGQTLVLAFNITPGFVRSSWPRLHFVVRCLLLGHDANCAARCAIIPKDGPQIELQRVCHCIMFGFGVEIRM
ncbi:hypothetical protein BO79DRAFT_491 [Aspergillus costaricaensis CBS 115574]|uniref:Uncharacterized protein n=1 Tax=Aspergillus costaricaensis CBS 115574 TaxID=1448317 RepID=A0ACD1IU92_9EURO|nr:hypothetical protein BO79DRAFT_491 [Aspergillus costaricaensis CBS 115574]RAK94055.1 hypothetical protein BO79DRAFT_491 [Aspergillus costaricaensis CBS 115574]